MKAAIGKEAGQPPIYGNFQEPSSASDELRIRVTAAAITNVTKSRAAGMHDSTTNEFPFVVGVDGVGPLDDGRRVYVALPRALWQHGGARSCQTTREIDPLGEMSN